MNNIIFAICRDCGGEFCLPVPALLDDDPENAIGDNYWCGYCDSHSYDCYWGMFHAGDSSDKIKDVLRMWNEWASCYWSAAADPQSMGTSENNP